MYKIIDINEYDSPIKKLSRILTEIHNELFPDKAGEKYFSDILNNSRYSVYCLTEGKSEEISGYIIYYDTTENI
ncbi:MAG: hypothetical protein Q4D53_07780, partial [Leptotrichiaceae bacterium]|nr:hypothetical protein [Leptotrichiaceae bacterium]